LTGTAQNGIDITSKELGLDRYERERRSGDAIHQRDSEHQAA